MSAQPRSGPLPLVLVAAAFSALVGGAVLLPWLLGLDAPPPPRTGSAAPALELADLDGRPVGLDAYRGKVVFVNFWATWCPPCRDEAPSLERLHRRLGDQGFAVLAVSVDAPGTDADVRAFRDEFGLRFPILLDPDKSAYRAFGVTGVPETFLVDADGRIVEHFIGPRDWDQPRYASAVRRLLTRRASPPSTEAAGAS